jgi:Protein kinase domain
MVGEALGSYRLVAELGSGGMGVVYLAEHVRIERRAAIKLLVPELGGKPDILRRFFNEARATSMIHHPGIVEVFDCDIDARGRAFIVMEYLQGETLARRIHRFGAMPWDVACVVGQQIALAVGAAHAKGIIHRDLKPDNVFLALDPASPGVATVKVLDFGIAKLLAGDPLTQTSGSGFSLVGTPEYMSPEQCGGAGRVDHRADIYSLGCILFEMVCARAPFLETALPDMIAAHLFKRPPLATAIAPDCPEWLADLIARMLAKRPAERPAAMADVAQALERGAAGSGGIRDVDTFGGATRTSGGGVGRTRIEEGGASLSLRLGAMLGILSGVGIAAAWGPARHAAPGPVARAAMAPHSAATSAALRTPGARGAAAGPAVGPPLAAATQPPERTAGERDVLALPTRSKARRPPPESQPPRDAVEERGGAREGAGRPTRNRRGEVGPASPRAVLGPGTRSPQWDVDGIVDL